MTSYNVVLMNMTDGSVQGHAAGCADLKKRNRKFAEPSQADYPMKVVDCDAAREEYNADFDEETDGWYDITWMPCAKAVPSREDRQRVEEFGEELANRLTPEELDSPTVSIDHLVVGPKGGVIIQIEVEGRTIFLRKADAVKLARQLNKIAGV